MWIVFQTIEIDFQTCLNFASARYKRPCVAKETKFTMNLSANCAICLTTMLRKEVIQLMPCMHFLHTECCRHISGENENFTCPICRCNVDESEAYQRKQYATTTARDRERIVECSNRGEDWKALAVTLGVNYQTAYTWIRSGQLEGAKRGGRRPKVLSDHQVEMLVSWLESDCSLTLVQMKQRLLVEENVILSTTSIANYLEGQAYTIKRIHWEPSTMNSPQNKELRKRYVIDLNNYIQQGRQVLWLDETNFNLFCRRECGRSRQGTRATSLRPTSRGKHFFHFLSLSLPIFQYHLLMHFSCVLVITFRSQRPSHLCPHCCWNTGHHHQERILHGHRCKRMDDGRPQSMGRKWKRSARFAGGLWQCPLPQPFGRSLQWQCSHPFEARAIQSNAQSSWERVVKAQGSCQIDVTCSRGGWPEGRWTKNRVFRKRRPKRNWNDHKRWLCPLSTTYYLFPCWCISLARHAPWPLNNCQCTSMNLYKIKQWTMENVFLFLFFLYN